MEIRLKDGLANSAGILLPPKGGEENSAERPVSTNKTSFGGRLPTYLLS
jgi:hypothetical protein